MDDDVNVTSLPCEFYNYSTGSERPRASKRCNERGNWEDTVFDACWTRSQELLFNISLRDINVSTA